MREFFTIKVKTINEVVQEFPPTLNFFCNDVVPLGPDLVREIGSPNECIAVYKLFMFEQDGNRYGTEEVKDMAGWRQYINAKCKCCPETETGCFVTYNGCQVSFNGCEVTIPCELCNN